MTDFTVHVPGHPPFLLARHRPELVLGRAPDGDVVLEDQTISRRHAKFTWAEDALLLEDLDSRHGTFRNGHRLRGPEAVTPRDRVTLGRLELRIERAEEPGIADPEETPLSLSMQDLRRWSQGGPGSLTAWREALDLLHDASLLMLQDLEPARLLEELLNQLFGFLQAGRGAVLFRGQDGKLAPLAVRQREEGPEGPLGLSQATLESTLNRRVAVLFREPLEPGLEGRHGRLADSNTTSVMAVPLEHEGEVLGLFYFDAAERRTPFTEQDLRFVATLSNLAAAKLMQQRLREELRLREEQEREVLRREAEAQAKGEFLARMSHELRTPMNAVLGFARMARQESLPASTGEFLRKIEVSGRRLLGVVDDVLDFSRLEAGKVALEAVPFDLRQEVEAALDLVAPAAAEKGLTLELVLRGDPPSHVLGDPLRLGQILANLAANAVKFTERGGVTFTVVHLGPGEAGARLAFHVRDTGIGISEEQALRLFQPYAQAGAGTARRFGGTGLGLAISRELAALMGGDLSLESTPGAGSTFTLSLTLPEAPAPEATAGVQAPDLHARRLLLVEDNVLNQELAAALLQETGAEVAVAGTGEMALEHLASRRFDAILMDLQLPGMDGIETARRVRASGFTGPIIALTAQGGDLSALGEAGMDDLVPKPIEPRRLFAALARHVRPAPAELPAGGAFLPELEPVMDVAGALARLDGRKDLLLRFLRGFLAEPWNPDAIPAAMARDDRDAARRAAHDLKGMAATLGLADTRRLASDLEDLFVWKDPGNWEEVCRELLESVDTFRACAFRALENSPGVSAPPGDNPSH
jgi:signal transduction histidine kinase/CheY-like chemotaxis protein